MQLFLSALVLVAAVSSSYGQDACPAIWAPVCGSDGQTYSNKCFLKAQAQHDKPYLTLVHSGPCDSRSKREVDNKCPEYSKHGICTLEYMPVCASNGKTYPNKCGMCVDIYEHGQNGLHVVHYGPCEKVKRDVQDNDEKCPEYSKHGICTLEYAPVCASNGKTYANKCGMCAEMYEQNTKLHVVHYGPCEKVKRDVQDNDEKCPEYSKHGICTLEYAPVCASNGKTYANKCGMCAEMYEQNTQLHVVHQGKCESDATLYEAEFCRPEWKTGVCTREYNPICGSDGVTYGNPCTFCYSMFEKQANGNDMKVKREGPCQDEDKLVCPERSQHGICTREYAPVCGSDGLIYANPCMFCYQQAQKLKEGVELYFDHHGICYM